MADRPNPIVFLVGLAAGIGGALYFRMSDPSPAPPPEAPPPPVASVPREPAAPEPAVLPDDPSEREAAIRATRQPSERRYPIEPQYAEGVRSDVPHEWVAAYDEAPEGTRGARRLFILAVAPDTPAADLERLVADLRTEHLDATALRIQVYDSKAAATHPMQAGTETDPHLVASYARDEAGVTDEVYGAPAAAE